ncbi:phytanoyl-CoA dioxygenase family protein [Verrucomicrobium sp. BvORR106]|uniref:phytanoyl-CoA dioxygenase family protein n=1 Tax=Verrucomicrobium sp. BvORR106 TaxID=1403819 RepID=UPI000570980E|nr:phytanoyl-CoA dioxygenase family protein [Verrucomicrobium sp. BvORR106]
MEPCTHALEGSLVITPAELDAKALSAEHLRQAALLLHTRGYVILKGAMPLLIAHAARDEFSRIFQDCVASKEGDGWYQVARETQAVFWERNFRWRIFPKLRGTFSDAWIVANPLAMQVVNHLLGSELYCKFVSSDTCLKGAVIQSPHRELGSGDQWSPRAYVVNVPLVHCGLENGPLEVWYTGSHLWRNEVLRGLSYDDDVQDGRNPQAEELADLFPSRRVVLELGDVLIRDPGLLHRGTVNFTDDPRSMLTVCLMRQGESHSYGEATYSLDREMWQALDPAVQPLFAHAFREPEPVTPAELPAPASAPTPSPRETKKPAKEKASGNKKEKTQKAKPRRGLRAWWPWTRG